MTDIIRVLIVDDHTVVRLGLRMLLDTDDSIFIVGEAANGQQALNAVEHHQPDVVIMDIAMPDMDGLEATRRIKERWPHINVLALTMHRHGEYFFNMLHAGVSGYLYKGDEATELIDAVRVIHSGEIFLPATLTKRLLTKYLHQHHDAHDPHTNLTAREREILHLLAQGLSPNCIAEQLRISASTVYTHYRNVMEKLNLDSRQNLIQYARQHNL